MRVAALDNRSEDDLRAEAERGLIEEWPAVLGTMILLSRTAPNVGGENRAEHLDRLARWDTDPIDAIHDFLTALHGLDEQRGDFSDRAGNAESAVYFLAYLGRSRARTRQLLDIYMPLLRPGLWDNQFRWRLEFIFFESAWAEVFDEGGIEEPTSDQDFDWPGSLNDLSRAERGAFLAMAGLSVLPYPERPTVAPWNEGHMNLAWLTAEVER